MADVGKWIVETRRRVEAQIDVVAGDAILPLPVERVIGGDAYVRTNLTLNADRCLIAVRVLRVRRSDRLSQRASNAARPEIHVAERLLEILDFRQRSVPWIHRKIGEPVVERRQPALCVGKAD